MTQTVSLPKRMYRASALGALAIVLAACANATHPSEKDDRYGDGFRANGVESFYYIH